MSRLAFAASASAAFWYPSALISLMMVPRMSCSRSGGSRSGLPPGFVSVMKKTLSGSAYVVGVAKSNVASWVVVTVSRSVMLSAPDG